MENKFSFADYKDFSEEDLKKLPLDDLARLTYRLLQGNRSNPECDIPSKQLLNTGGSGGQ
jgi:hypothetical protein